MTRLIAALLIALFAGPAYAQNMGGGGINNGSATGAGGSGTVTSVATGTGLSGGPITTTGTVSCGQATSAAFGCVKVDGTTITASGGVISSVGGSGTVTSISTTGQATGGTITTSGTISTVWLTSPNSPTGSSTYTIQGGTGAGSDAYDSLLLASGFTGGVTLPAATGTGFGAGCPATPANCPYWQINNQTGGTITMTVTTSTLDGASSVAIPTGKQIAFYSDGTNYHYISSAASSGGTPGGSNTQLQYNSSGAFGGISGWTTNGSTTLTGGSSTTIAIGGCTIGSLVFCTTGAATLAAGSGVNSFSSSNAGGGFAVTNSANTANLTIGSFLDSSFGTGQTLFLNLGIKAATNDWASFGFTYVGDGSSSNAFCVGFYGVGCQMTLTAAGAMSLPSLAASSAATTGTVCWTTGGNLTVDTTLACLASLEELKDIHGPITGALSEVSKLDPFWYTWKDGTPQRAGDTQEQPGLGAHQVAAVDKRLVSYSDDGKLLGVRYQELTALLVQAIKEQQAEIDELKRAH